MGRSFGSKACASTPRCFSAESTALPLSSEISRSLESPPSITAVLPKSLADEARRLAASLSKLMPDPPRSCRFSDDPHFRVQFNARLGRDRPLHMQDQRFDVRRPRLAMIDDEIGVLLGHRRIADAKALQTGAF